MKNAMLGSAVLLLAGCQGGTMLMPSHVAEPTEAAECKGAGAGSNSDDCTILVDVQQSADGRTCTVKVQASQDEVLFAAGVANKRILWQIDANPGGYRFTQQGVAFKSDPHNNFKDGKRLVNGQVFRWKNGGTPDSYKYDVQVHNPKTGVTCTQDPVIKNQ